MTLRELRDLLTEQIEGELSHMADLPVKFATDTEQGLSLLSIYDSDNKELVWIDIGESDD